MRSPKKSSIVHVLHLEDDPADAELVHTTLWSAGMACRITCARSRAEFDKALSTGKFDIILADYLLPGYDGVSALRLAQERCPDVPFIFVSGTMGEDAAIEGLTQGATDYVLKQKLSRLVPAVRRALHEAENRRERKRSEEELFRANKRWERTFDAVPDLIAILDNDFKIVQANKAMASRLGRSPEECVGQVCYKAVHGTGSPPSFCPHTHTLRDRREHMSEVSEEGLGGDFVVSTSPIYDVKGEMVGSVHVARDITERKRAEEENRRLEILLHQAQKMEAIGTLAGGIAHDFNNLLTVMTGYGTLLKMRLDEADPLGAYVDEIVSASEKAATLTRSLLAFSREQPIHPNPLRINDVIKGTEKLLRRLIAEDITLNIRLAPDDIVIMADATHIDQILFNLATNARDAMPKGGTLSIETRLVEFDREFIQSHGFGEPGKYALLSVSDTGIGMDEKTKAQIFDPFFTTKEVGKGTGLGLSTAYGIVRQHNGYISVDSGPDAGTTFHIYLPAIAATAKEEQPVSLPAKRGRETILVAEDNAGVRSFIRDVLTQYGYEIVEAADGEEAVHQFEKQSDIDLLILDSVMPKMGGIEVYDEISKRKPGMKVLFMSGYTRDSVLPGGLGEREFDLISKPLSPKSLLEKTREVLDRCGS